MFFDSRIRDGLSLSLGVISVISWIVAEIPQIMTNYKEKSTEGLSISFLTTWMIGDIFNILGCLMEPATLPIQLYMAILYTVASAILYLQSIYYRYLKKKKKINHQRHIGLEEPLQSGDSPSTKPLLCVVSVFLFLGMFSLSSLMSESRTKKNQDRVFVVGGARKLLRVGLEESNSKIGILLGWAMTAIFIGGRIPQIRLNMQRGNVEGLNPMMFFFTLVGNVSYVASILVKSIEWVKVAPNLPWLIDAGGCVLLDFLILLQFYHFKHKHSGKKHETVEEEEEEEETV